jgi:site-specific DNA recombinase
MRKLKIVSSQLSESVVIYARVSSREQEKEGYSIPAQIRLLEEYAQREGMSIARRFSEAETAKISGREEFNKMLDFLSKEAKAQGVRTILVEKTDRLYRNFKDYVRLEELDVAIHFVKENEILSKDSRSSSKFVHGIKVLMAKNYIDNLSEEVKKGRLEKARQGHYPMKAPYGYRNNKETRLIDIDTEQAIWVRRAFQLYGSGQHSLDQVREQLYAEGMRFKSAYKEKVHKSTLAKLLQNIFYTGDFIMNDQFFKGKHEPLITISQYQQTQKVFEVANKPKHTKHDFAFSGLLTCGICGCSITPQIQKQKYVYYHCSQGKGECKGRYVREEVLAEQFAKALERLQISEDQLAWLIPALKSSHADEREFHEGRVRELRERYDKLSKRLDQVYEDKLDGKIPEELWFRKHEEYKAEMLRVTESLRQHEQGNFDYVESGIRILELAKNASLLYSQQNMLEKRRILNFLLSNCSLADGKVDYDYLPPFDLIASGVNFEKDSGWVDKFRTILIENADNLQQFLIMAA